MKAFSEGSNKILDEIIKTRRSIRSFTPDIPPRDLVERIIEAGLLAPYSLTSLTGSDDYRRFIVIPKSSISMHKVTRIFLSHLNNSLRDIENKIKENVNFRPHGELFKRVINEVYKRGIPGVGTAPYYIIVAERRGLSSAEQSSLSHCLQNMWLKATALGLGFHLVTLTTQLAEDEEFCKIIGIPPGQFALNGCAIGYPNEILPPKSTPNLQAIIKWMP